MTRIERARKLRQCIDTGLAGAIQSGAVDVEGVRSLADNWRPHRNYAAGEYCVRGNKLFKCIKTHTSQPGQKLGSVSDCWEALGKE